MKIKIKRKILVLIAGFFIFAAGYFFWSNSGIEGVYQCNLISGGPTEEQGYVVLMDGGVFFATYDGYDVDSMKETYGYYQKNGRYFINHPQEIDDVEVSNEVSVDFSAIKWPFYDHIWTQIMPDREKSSEDLSRVLNPFLKSKIYREIRNRHVQKEKSILGLW